MSLTTERRTSSEAGGAHHAPRLTYRPDLDGLRALAVGLVVLYHLRVPGVSGGYIGVDVFFVISGFLITSILVGDAERGRFSLLGFYSGRVRRLLPLSTFVLVVTVAFALWTLPAAQVGILLGDARSALLYVSNWHFAARSIAYTDVQVSEGLLTHFWSLSVEEQFYFVWPVVIFGCVAAAKRLRNVSPAQAVRVVAAVVVVLSFAASATLTASGGGQAYFFTHLRLWEMGAGALMAGTTFAGRWVPGVRNALALLSVAAIVAVAFIYDEQTVFPGVAAAVPVLATVALIGVGTAPYATGRALGLTPFRYLGERSYALYLWHWPALGAVIILDARYGWQLGQPWTSLIALATALALTIASHRLIENPLRYSALLRRHLATTAIVGLAASIVLVALSFPVNRRQVAAESRAWSELPLSPATATNDTATTVYGACNQSLSAVFKGLKWCEVGDPLGSKTVAIIGDSHAQHWAPALDAAGKANGWKVLVTTRSACLPYDVAQYNARTELMDEYCRSWGRAVSADLAARGDVDLLVVGRRYAYARSVRAEDGADLTDAEAQQAVQQGARAFFGALDGAVGHIAVLEDTTALPHSMPDCLAAQTPATASECDVPNANVGAERFLIDAERAAATAIAGPPTEVISVDDIACPNDVCASLSPLGIITFRDTSHMTVTFSTSLAEQIAERLSPFLD